MQGDLFDTSGWINLPDAELYYQPDFIPANEAQYLFETLEQTLPWEQIPIRMYGRDVLQPRLQAWFGEPYCYTGLQLQSAPMPQLLQEIQNRCEAISQSPFNSVFANLYRDGSDYMGWHQDNERELGQNPTIASVTLGEARRFVLRHLKTKEKFEFNLSAGSLLIMSGKIQHHWQHAVPKTAKPKKARINLTYRYIYSQ